MQQVTFIIKNYFCLTLFDVIFFIYIFIHFIMFFLCLIFMLPKPVARQKEEQTIDKPLTALESELLQSVVLLKRKYITALVN